jgi:hypothetical protein
VNEGLVFVDVECGTGDFFVFESGDEGSFVNHGTARGIDEERGGLHTKEFGSVEKASGFREQGDVETDKVGAREKSVHIGEFAVKRFYDVLGRTHRVRVEHFHLKTQSAASDGTPDAAETDNTESFAPNIRTTKLVEIPTLPVSGTSQGFTLVEAASDGEKKSPGKIGGGFVENTGRVGGDDTTLGAGVNVDIVEPDGYVGDDAEFWRGAKKFVIDFFSEKADEGFAIFEAAQNFIAWRAIRIGPILNVAIGVEDFSGFFE